MIGNLDIEWRSETRKIKDLVQYSENPRIIRDRQKEELKVSIERFGYVETVIIQPDGLIIGGHQRVTAMIEMGHGEQSIEVRVPSRDLTTAEMQELNLRLNLNKGEFDFGKLMNRSTFNPDVLLAAGFERNQVGMQNDLLVKPQSLSMVMEQDTHTIRSIELESVQPTHQETASQQGNEPQPPLNLKSDLVKFEIDMPKDQRDILFRKLNDYKTKHSLQFLRESFAAMVDKFEI